MGKTRLERSGFALWCLCSLLTVSLRAQPTELLQAPSQKTNLENASKIGSKALRWHIFQMWYS